MSYSAILFEDLGWKHNTKGFSLMSSLPGRKNKQTFYKTEKEIRHFTRQKKRADFLPDRKGEQTFLPDRKREQPFY